MGIDIGILKSADLNHASRVSPILDANGHPYPGVSITVVSVDSDKYRDFQQRAQQVRLDRAQTFGRMRISAEEVADEQLDMLVACTVDWEGFEQNGTPLPPTADNVRLVYRTAPWIREQVNVFIGDRRNFFAASANGYAKQ